MSGAGRTWPHASPVRLWTMSPNGSRGAYQLRRLRKELIDCDAQAAATCAAAAAAAAAVVAAATQVVRLPPDELVARDKAPARRFFSSALFGGAKSIRRCKWLRPLLWLCVAFFVETRRMYCRLLARKNS